MRFRILSSLAVPVGLMVVACKSSSPSSVAADASGGAAAAPNEGPAVAVLAFLEGFEGEIDAQFTKGKSAETPTAVSALLKTGKFRFDIPEKLTESKDVQHFFGPKAYGVFDSTAKKLSLVSDTKKEVLVIDMNKSGERFNDVSHRRPSPASKPEERERKIDKTGRFETVAGRQCEDWDVSSDHREATVCVAHDGISWFSLPVAALPTEHAWALELMDGKHFPMKFVGYDKDAMTEDSRFEITKMEKKSVPDSAFQGPADFQVMDLDQLMQSLAGMRGAMAGAMGAGPGVNAGLTGATGATPGAGGMAPAQPPGMPSNIPGLTPEQMQQIQQRLQQMQQRRPH
jgi:hypothetical protein